MKCDKRKYGKLPLALINKNTNFIDTEDPELIKELKLRNFSALYYYYLSKDDRNALKVLHEKEKNMNDTAVVEEIILTNIYFKEYENALEYIEKCKIKAPQMAVYEYLIKISFIINGQKTYNSRDTVISLVKEALTKLFDRRLIEILIDFYKDDNLKEKLKIVQELVNSYHLDSLSYSECKFLYKKMPDKKTFLKKMVQLNPRISKKYYLEYSKYFGFRRDEIIRILKSKFQVWALEIAMFFGWVDESLRESFEKEMVKIPLAINKDKEVEERDVTREKFYRFKQGIERSKDIKK